MKKISFGLSKLKGSNKFETAENYSIFAIFIGAVLFALGILLNVVSTKGISTMLSMLGALISFVSTVSLVVIWAVKEFKMTE